MNGDRDIEQAKAAQEIAKTTSKVVGAAEKFGEFVSKYIAGSLESGIGIFEDKLKYMRWERQHRLMMRATEFLEHEGMSSITPLPLKLAVPLLEAASLEEDDSLQDLYAKLLVNATNNHYVSRSYIDALERFTPLMAKLFDNSYGTQLTKENIESIEGLEAANLLPEDYKEMIIAPDISPEIQLAYSELDKLGCLRVERGMINSQLHTKAKLTLFGTAFYDACTLPSEKI